MATGTITYSAPVTGLRLERTEVASSHSAVEKVVLETQGDERINIVFYLTNRRFYRN